jgi:protein SCO1/2
MKTSVILSILLVTASQALASAAPSSASTPVPAACCVVPQVADACCAIPTASSTTAAAPSSRSLYQLDSSWTNDAGEHVQLAAFRGQPVIVAMFFAQCEYACPMIVADIERARKLLPPAVREKTQVVLVSFDSARDTPAALHAFRARMSLDSSWTLLRSEPRAVQEFAMLLGVKFKQDARGQFSHSNVITVLNPEGEIVHQRPGLQGDVSELAQAITLVTR